MQINVRGNVYPVSVSNTGIFSTVADGKALESDTLAGLRNKVLFGMAREDLATSVSFTIIRDDVIRHGTAVGVDERDGAIRVRWEDKPERVDYFVDWHHTVLERLDVGEAEEYRRLRAALWAAEHAVEKFEKQHVINLKDTIVARLDAAALNGKVRDQ